MRTSIRRSRPTLLKRLAADKIPTISWECAKQHRSSTMNDLLRGPKGQAGYNLRSLYGLLELVTLYRAELALARMGRWDDGGAYILRLATLSTIFMLGLTLAVSSNAWGLALIGLPVLSGVRGALYKGLQGTDIGRAAAVWRLQPLYRDAQRHLAERPIPQLPQKLKERAYRVSKLPGVRVLVWYIHDDPIIVAAAGYGPWTKYIVIGAYDTGIAELDDL